MQEVLLRKLIEQNLFKIGTEVDATYTGVGLSGQPVHAAEQTFTVVGLYETKKTNRIKMDVRSTFDGELVRIGVENIINIDGMVPERFAENYMFDPQGNEIKPSGKRRGRRPKGWAE